MPGYREVCISTAGTRTFMNHFREFRPDVIHLASPFMIGPPVIRAARNLGIPVVSVFQTDMAGFASQYGLSALQDMTWSRLRRIHDGADVTLVPSTATYLMLERQGFSRLALWPRGVDVDRFNPTHRSDGLRSRLGAPDRVLVGYVGRLAHEKEIAQLSVLRDDSRIQLVIVGDGPARESLHSLLPTAHFTGLLTGHELAQTVASLDVMVHTGRYETFCQSVQEAMASGVPVVAPASGGPMDLVQSSRTGWLYRPGDVQDLRLRVLDLVGDAYKRSAMGDAARAAVSHRTWTHIGDLLFEHYNSVMAGRRITRG
jgi:phosphatidylinositol alpha 1,6-mannosyltransferase